MAEQATNRVYISMMVDSLQRKSYILDRLLTLTKEQERLLSQSELDTDAFEATLESKGRRIDELNDVDAGFESLYKKFEDEILKNRDSYVDEIARMKELITRITEMSSAIMALEKKNDDRFQFFLSGQKKQIKDVHVNRRTVLSYAKNMTDIQKAGQSYFLDETK